MDQKYSLLILEVQSIQQILGFGEVVGTIGRSGSEPILLLLQRELPTDFQLRGTWRYQDLERQQYMSCQAYRKKD